MNAFAIRGFNPCESLLRHSPEQLRTFIRRMKALDFNTLIVHYDYGWKRYQKLILEECRAADVEIILMTFGPRTFFSYSDWKPAWFARRPDGEPFTSRLECETYPCRFQPEALEAFDYGARQWLKSLPPDIRHVHMRAADGIMFCQCPKCRTLLDHEKWQPFVEIFAQAVQETRPELVFETDIYVRRYNIPGNRRPFEVMGRIMYDTFYRSPRFPIGSHLDIFGKDCMYGATTEKHPDADTPNAYHLNRLKEWTAAFPEKVYIHENAMGQSLMGTFQYATGTYLRDLEIYRKLGVAGVCYEAYEPGYGSFSRMFEILSQAMKGQKVSYQPSPMELALQKSPMAVVCSQADFPLERYVDDPFQLQIQKFYRQTLLKITPELFREYLSFGFCHADRLDPLMIGIGLVKFGLQQKTIRFEHLSPEAAELISRRKLWDFMEDIPLDADPRAVTSGLMIELMEKVRN